MVENRFKLARTKYSRHGKQSVKTVAQNTGVTASLINDLEATTSKPRNVSYLTVATLSKYYGVSIDWLVGNSETPCIDVSIRSVCKATGLDPNIVKHLIEWNKTECSDDEINPILEFNTLFGNPSQLWTLMICVYANSLNIDVLGCIREEIAEERQNCYSEETGWGRPERAKDLLRQILELEKEIRYTRFEAIDTFTSIFDGVQNTKHLESEIDSLLEQFKGLKLDEQEG